MPLLHWAAPETLGHIVKTPLSFSTPFKTCLAVSVLLCSAALAPGVSADGETPKGVSVFDFSVEQPSDFKEKSFAGHTDYQLVSEPQGTVLRAEANNSASSLYREVRVDISRTPILNWSWRADNVHDIRDQQQKTGDDYAARLYVVIRTGIFPWQTRALNYVWSNYPSTQHHWPNPFTSKAVMLPRRGEAQALKKWHHERADIAADYLRTFGEALTHIDGIAIMTDADNSGGRVVAYYGDVYFSEH